MNLAFISNRMAWGIVRAIVAISLALSWFAALPAQPAHATTASLEPISNGTYTAWTNDYKVVNETSSYNCSLAGSIQDAGGATGLNTKESYNVDLSGIPNGALITSIDVDTIHRAEDARPAHTTGTYQTLIIFNGTETASGSNLQPLNGICQTSPNTQTFDVTDIAKSAGTTLQIGVVKTNAEWNVRVGAIWAVVTYVEMAAPTISKAFGPPSIAAGDTSTITFTLSNSNASALTGASFTDTLTNMAIGGNQSAGGSCTGASGNSLSDGATSLSFTGLTVPASSSCTVTVVVTSSALGANPNAASGVTTSQTAQGEGSSSVYLTVTEPQPEPTAPDLIVDKTNDTKGSGVEGTSFNWTLKVANQGDFEAEFVPGTIILSDQLPSGATYLSPTLGNEVGFSSGSILCSISGTNLLICQAVGLVLIGPTVTRKFDFGTDTSPRATGYTRVSNTTAYSPGGFGWLNTYYLESRDRGAPNDLNRDFVLGETGLYGTNSTFKADIPNGNYDVTVTMGDAWYAHDNMIVIANGATVLTGVNNAAGAFTSNTFNVNVSSGSLQLEFQDGDTTSPEWMVNHVEIVPTAPTGSFEVTVPTKPTQGGDLVNPTGGSCQVDPVDVVTESNEGNNTCQDTVSVIALGSKGIDKKITASNQDFTTDPGVTASPFSSLQDVAIGEIVTYQVDVHLQYGTYNQATLVDTMDKGLAFVDCTSIEGVNTTPSNFSTACANPTFLPQPTPPLPDSVDYKRIVQFSLAGGALTPSSSVPAPVTINVGAGGGTITFTYRAVVLDTAGNRGVPPAPYPTKLSNSAVFQYTQVPAPITPTTGPSAPPAELGPASVSVEVVEPQLQITKEADTEFVGLGTIVSFKVTVQHTPNSHTPAFDVVMTDPIPSQFDYYADLDCSTSTHAPDAPVENVNVGVITAGWSKLDLGDVGVCTFKLQANDTWSVGTNVSNVAYVQWTSLPGVPAAGAGCPADTGKQNCGDFSTERNFNPNDSSINNYSASSDTPFQAPGGGEREGKGKNFRLPGTGFAPGVVTALTGQPAVAYNDNLGVTLRIPKLKLNMAIEGVPYVNDVWQVDWLTGVGGWLQGTAYPGLSGNSVIMSHVVTHYGSPGPFARLTALNVGDNIFVTSLGRQYVYQVKKTGNVAADDISVLKHATKPVLTLITCSMWNEATQTYDGRFVVYAELIQ